MQSSVSLVCVINICSGSAKVPVNVEEMVATAPITPYFTELKGFFQLNPQQTTTQTLRSRTSVLEGHLPVNSHFVFRDGCQRPPSGHGTEGY